MPWYVNAARVWVLALVLFALLAALPGSALALDAEEDAFLKLLNKYRVENEKGPLALSPTLTIAAERHSVDMASNNYFSHTSADGRTLLDRIRATGYTYNTYTGENLAAGFSSAQSVFGAWKASADHDRNMLNANFRAVGLARAFADESTYGWYWTTVLGGEDDSKVEKQADPVDKRPPQISLTTPVDEATVSGKTPLAAAVSDDRTVDKVEFFLNERLLGKDTTAPYSWVWDTVKAPNGEHKLRAKATDRAGNEGRSSEIPVQVTNQALPTKKETTLKGRASQWGFRSAWYDVPIHKAGAIEANLTWSGDADLDLYLYSPEGALVGQLNDGSRPKTLAYDAKSEGAYRLRVRADSGASDLILVVATPAGGQPPAPAPDSTDPVLRLLAPLQGERISGGFNIVAEAEDNDEVVAVEFYVDGERVSEVLESPYVWHWLTTRATNGTHTVLAKARDAAGNTAEAKEVSVEVANLATGPTIKHFKDTVDRFGTSSRWYEMPVTEEGLITARLRWGGDADLDLFLYNPSGSLIARSSSGSEPESLRHFARKTGTYLVRVKAYRGEADYTLRVRYPASTGPADDQVKTEIP